MIAVTHTTAPTAENRRLWLLVPAFNLPTVADGRRTISAQDLMFLGSELISPKILKRWVARQARHSRSWICIYQRGRLWMQAPHIAGSETAASTGLTHAHVAARTSFSHSSLTLHYAYSY